MLNDIPQARSEADLPSRAKNDDFWVLRIAKFGILLFAIIVVATLVGMFIVELFSNTAFKDRVLDNLLQEVSTITVAVAAILGLNRLNRNP